MPSFLYRIQYNRTLIVHIPADFSFFMSVTFFKNDCCRYISAVLWEYHSNENSVFYVLYFAAYVQFHGSATNQCLGRKIPVQKFINIR